MLSVPAERTLFRALSQRHPVSAPLSPRALQALLVVIFNLTIVDLVIIFNLIKVWCGAGVFLFFFRSQVEEQKKRAEADKLAALTALEKRSREFLREKEEKRQLEAKISVMQVSGFKSCRHAAPSDSVLSLLLHFRFRT